MKIETISMTKIKVNPKNPKLHNDDAIFKSVQTFGIRQPIIVTPDGKDNYRIVAGHGRLTAFSKIGQTDIPCIVWNETDENVINAYMVADNSTVIGGGWDDSSLSELMQQLDADMDIDMSVFGFDEMDLRELLDDDEPGDEVEIPEPEGLPDDFKDWRILNLYAGIGGNRKFWPIDGNITAVEYNSEIAKCYQSFFPNDKVIVADAHKYLEEHFEEYDFIWSSPPCPTHSRLKIAGVAATRKGNTGCIKYEQKPVYPDMKLYEEIIFLNTYFNGLFVIENVESYYEPLINPEKIDRHYFWTNVEIRMKEIPEIIRNPLGNVMEFNAKNHLKSFGFSETFFKSIPNDSSYPRDKIIRNMVHPKIGEFILKSAYPKSH